MTGKQVKPVRRNRRRRPRLIGVLGIGALVAVTVPASGGAGTPTPTCHGRPATVVGTPGNDEFDRRDVDDGDVFVLLGGRDSVTDDAKSVAVCGGAGHDRMYALGRASGQRTLFDGGRDTDYVLGGFPGPGNPKGPRGPLHLFGGKGYDELSGGRGDDTIQGGSGDDFVWGVAGNDLIRGGPGEDLLRGSSGGDRLYGNGAHDRLIGNGGSDKLYGHGGRDALIGGSAAQSDRSRDLADGGRNSDRCRAEVKRRCER